MTANKIRLLHGAILSISSIFWGISYCITGAAPIAPLLEVRDGIYLNSWLIVGPETVENSSDISHARLSWLSEPANVGVPLSQKDATFLTSAGFKVTQGTSENGILDLQNVFSRPYVPQEAEHTAVVFLETRLGLGADSDAWLQLSNAGKIEIWLNGVSIYKYARQRGISTFDDAVRIHLHAGENLLRVKLVQDGGNWGIAAYISKSVEDAGKVALEGMRITPGYIVKDICTNETSPLVFSVRGAPHEFTSGGQVNDPNGKSLVTLSVTELGAPGWTPTLPKGIYELVVGVAGKDYAEQFCVGTIDENIELAMREASPYFENTKKGEVLKGLAHRIDFLCRKENKPNGSLTWHRRVIFCLYEMKRIVGEIRLETKHPFYAGLQLCSFISKIDGAPQYYRAYVPKKALNFDLNDKFGTVIMLPTSISATRPFIDSVFMNEQSEAERIAAIAEKSGLIVIWSGYRNKPQGIPTELTHLDEVLEDASSNFPIDQSRLYLCGACGGGASAVQEVVASRYSFSGVGLLNPMFGLPGLGDQNSDYLPFADYRHYQKDIVLIPFLLKYYRTPFFLLHDGAEPGHGDLKVCTTFIDFSKFFNYPVEFTRRPQLLAQHYSAWEEIFSWFARAAPVPQTSSKKIMNPAIGTVADAVSSQFVVVTGTGGSLEEKEFNTRIANGILRDWQKTQFTSCRAIQDVDWDAKKYREYNIVLVGNRASNTVWSAFNFEFPVAVESERIAFGDKVWEGRNLSLCAVCKEKGSVPRKIVVLAATNPHDGAFGSLDLSKDGWYTYAIYKTDAESHSRKLIDARRTPVAGDSQVQ